MTQIGVKPEESYLTVSEHLESTASLNDSVHFKGLRNKARKCFQELGFPVERRGNEEWKYTDVSPIAKIPFEMPDLRHEQFVRDIVSNPVGFGKSHWNKLVFVDGKYEEKLSVIKDLPDNVIAKDFNKASKGDYDLIGKHLGNYADFHGNAFNALNTSFLDNGAFISIPNEVVINDPIEIIFMTTGLEQDTFIQPRILVLVGDNSKVAIVESYVGIEDTRYFNNSVTELAVGNGANLEYYKIQTQSRKSFHITNTEIIVGKDSTFSSMNIDLGGKLVRNNLNLLTNAEGSYSVLNGLYLVNGTQHVDNQVIIDHAKPHTTSRELYKGILDGKSKSVFHGSIIVREGAYKVNANQVDKNLLLSDKAEAYTKPAFWVYCDDVLCGHGAACGQMDENALFYLRSRGIDELSARSLLTLAFVSEVIDSIGNEHLREQINDMIHSRLEDWLGIFS